MIQRVATVFLGIAGACLASYLLFFDPVPIRIEPGEIEGHVAAQLPISRNLPEANILIDKITFTAAQEGKLEAEVTFQASGRGLSGMGTASLATGITYEGGSFHLSNPVPDAVDVVPDDASIAFIAAVSANASKTWARFLRQPESRTPEMLAKWDDVKDHAMLRLEPRVASLVSSALADLPVFSLYGRSLPFELDAASLKDVTLSNGGIDAKLDPHNLPLHALAGFLLLSAIALGVLRRATSVRRS